MSSILADQNIAPSMSPNAGGFGGGGWGMGRGVCGVQAAEYTWSPNKLSRSNLYLTYDVWLGEISLGCREGSCFSVTEIKK
jgi:hypothetical protein